MFSQHPFTLEHRYSSDECPALPSWKRALDLVCCFAWLPLLGILTFFFSLVGVLCSNGPVFYRQEYVGYLGRRFAVYRFRTMHVLSQAGARRVTVEDAGLSHGTTPSFIPGGRFLRASGLVDLPQIVNVLRAEMSIVGPRPYLDSGRLRATGLRKDVMTVPGLTGLWRLAGENPSHRNESVHWEQTYAEKMSLWTDLKVIARSTLLVFGRGIR